MAVINKCDLRTYRRDAYCRIRNVMRLGDTQGTGQISSRVLYIVLAIHSKERRTGAEQRNGDFRILECVWFSNLLKYKSEVKYVNREEAEGNLAE